jgi:hypothetical protein
VRQNGSAHVAQRQFDPSCSKVDERRLSASNGGADVPSRQRDDLREQAVNAAYLSFIPKAALGK